MLYYEHEKENRRKGASQLSIIKNLKIDDKMKEKLEYIGLDLNEIPETLKQNHDIKIRITSGKDERQFKQYKFINVNDIDILISEANAFSELKEKYENASPLYTYLNAYEEDNMEKYYTFLKILKKVDIEEIKKVEKEQELLAKNIPFKVRFNGNYLWSIYYSERTDRYFMLVPTENANYATFFYLLKKKIESKKNDKIFVPISYLDYAGKVLKKSEIKDIENYLWLFTKEYPSIYEVYNKKGEPSIQIVGETDIYGKVKTIYKLSYETSKEANKFYKLLKALFILQTELPHYYKFSTNIDNTGKLEIYLENTKIEYDTLLEFILEQYLKSVSLKEQAQDDIEELNNRLEQYKKESVDLESEYIAKEKQISTFLECKKSFFGKVKYYFKLGKKSKHHKKDKNMAEEIENQNSEKEKVAERKKEKVENRNYTLDELVASFKQLEEFENQKKNIVMDINALKLKNKNLKKKIENATAYINEINQHKKSIFEFWKYSNKDEMAALEEGEEEELNITKIDKTFNYDNDFEKFGESIDRNQRNKLTDDELDSVYLAATDLLDLINRTYKKQATAKEFSEKLKDLKINKDIDEDDVESDFDIFGKLSNDKTKLRSIKNKTHRETPRNKYQILNIQKEMKGLDLKKEIVSVVKHIKKAIKKNSLDEDIFVYKATPFKLDVNELQTFSLNEESEIEEFLKKDESKNKFYLYRIRLNKGTNYVGFSNIIYFNNKNMTLPLGMQMSDKILIDLQSLELNEINKKDIRKIQFLDDKNDFSKINLKTIEVEELESKKKEKKSKNKKEENVED